MARKYLYINDTKIDGIYISSDTYLNSPSFDYSEFKIPGRDGNVIIDNKRMNNVMRKFDCYIPESGNINTALSNLKRILYSNRGYLKIASDYDQQGVYQYGYLAQELNINPFHNKAASFSLYFSCLPNIYDSAVGEHQTDNDIGISTYIINFKSNDDSELVAFKSQLKNDYPYSPIGWLYGRGGSSSFLTEGSTYTINATSSDTQKYVVLLGKIPNWTTPQLELKFDVLCEVTNYAQNGITFTVPTEGYPHYVISFATPILFNDINISATWTGGSADVTANMKNAISDYFTSLGAVGAKPIFVYQKKVSSSHINDGVMPIDLFALNEGRYIIDFDAMANDLGRQFIYDNYVVNDNVYVYLDFVEKKAYLLDSLDTDGNRIADISAYFKCYAETLFGDSFTVKCGSIHELSEGGTTYYFIFYGIDGKITFNMNWWRI